MSEELQQILYSLERAAAENERVRDRLMAVCDYSAEFPGRDAENIRKAIELLRGAPAAEQPVESPEQWVERIAARATHKGLVITHEEFQEYTALKKAAEQPFDQLSLDGAGGVTRRRDAEQQQQEPVAANLLSMLLKENQSPNYDELWIDLDMCARLISEFLAGYTHQQPQAQGEPERMTNARHHGCHFDGWQCFHCGEVFETYGGAQDHFGFEPSSDPACRIKIGAERGLVMALREAEKAAADTLAQLHAENGDAVRAFSQAVTRHQDQLRAMEELGYERGLRANTHPQQPADQEENDYLVTRLSTLLAEIAVALKGESPNKVLYSFHDLPELAAKLKAELEIYRQGLEQNRAAVPDGMRPVMQELLTEVEEWEPESLLVGDFTAGHVAILLRRLLTAVPDGVQGGEG